MQQRKMGRTGLKVSNICLGTMTSPARPTRRRRGAILDVATEEGVTFIDTADAYPIPPEPETAGLTEEIIGRWLAAEPGRRDGSWWPPSAGSASATVPTIRGSRRHILAACDASLKRLKTDWIDLYQSHSPDPETPLDETLRAFDDLVRAGEGSLRGLLELPAWQLALAPDKCPTRPGRYDCVQPRYNACFIARSRPS